MKCLSISLKKNKEHERKKQMRGSEENSFKRESFVTSISLRFHKSRKERCCILTLALVVAAVRTNMCSPGGLEAEGDLGQ